MKLTHENLDPLKTHEYKEYLRLQKKNFDGCLVTSFGWILLHILLASIAGLTISGIALLLNYSRGEISTTFWVVTFLYLTCVPLSLFFTGIVGLALDEKFAIGFKCESLSKKSSSYNRFQELALYFTKVEENLEDQVREYVRGGDVSSLIQSIKVRRTDKYECKRLIDILRYNHYFIKEVDSFIDIKPLVSIYKEELKSNDIWFEDELEELEKSKHQKNPSNSLGLNSDWKNTSWNTGKSSTKQNTKYPQREIDDNEKDREVLLQNSSELEPEQREQLKLFEPESEEIETTTNRTRLFKPRVIKASSRFWEDLNKKRMKIGKKGELLVLEYERKRILREEGKEFLDRLKHVSVAQGDGLGYDILSFESGTDIYIEVKTTTGKFSSELFFSENEKKVMEDYDSKYYLYRVYRYDAKNRINKLRILKGRAHIESVFDFNPHSYRLKKSKLNNFL